MMRVLRCAAIVLLLGAIPASGQTGARPDSDGGAEVPTAPVQVDGTTLFSVRGVSSYPAETRASIIAGRVGSAAADRSLPLDAVHVVEREGVLVIVARDTPLMGVSDADAALEGVSRAAYAAAHLFRIRQAIADYRESRTRGALLRSARSTAVATLALAAIVVLLIWLWRRFDALLRQRVESKIHGVGIQSFEVVRAERIQAALRTVFLAVRAFVFAASLLVYAGYVLSHWPWTRKFSHSITEFSLAPIRALGGAAVSSLPSLAFLLVLAILVRVTLRVLRLFFDAVGRGAVTLNRFDAEWAEPTYKIVRLGIIVLAVIVAYPYIPGADSAAFKGVSVFLGIVFSLGSSTAVANILAGYSMTYRRAFKVGDRVKIGDIVGEVLEIRLSATHLRSYKNEEIVMANSQIIGAEIVNFTSLSHDRGLILHTEVGIGYETPWRQVEALLLEAARQTPGLAEEPRPFVHLKKLGDFAVVYELNAYCHDTRQIPHLYTAMHRNVLDVFNAYGVQIMTPAYEGDPEQPKVVPEKDWYTAPAAAPVSTGSLPR